MTEQGRGDGASANAGQGAGDTPTPGPASAVLPARRGGAGTRSWVGLVANPGAGRGRGRAQVAALTRELRRRGLRPRISWTPEGRAALVAESAADPRARCLVAVGGDGTVAALINDAPGVPITVLPSGTENLFARHFRLGRCPRRLAAVIDAGKAHRIDLGRSQDRRFSLMAGVGFDAEVVTRHHTARVGTTGVPRPTTRTQYVDPVLRASFEYGFPEVTVRVEDAGAVETLTGTTVFVFNLPRYALGLPFAPSARDDDGWLDLLVFQKPGPFHALHYLWLVVRRLHLRRPGVQHRRVRRVSITTADHAPYQLDGDPGGIIDARGMTVAVEPAALDVLVPPSFEG